MRKLLLSFIILLCSFPFVNAQLASSNDIIIFYYTDFTPFIRGNNGGYIPEKFVWVGNGPTYLFEKDGMNRIIRAANIMRTEEYIYTYDDRNRMIQENSDYYGSKYITYYTYNDMDLLIEKRGSGYKEQYVYNENGKVTDIYYNEKVEGEGDIWKTKSKQECIYENNNPKELISYTLVDGNWIENPDRPRKYFICDEYENIIEERLTPLPDYKYAIRFLYTQDINGNWFIKRFEEWSWVDEENALIRHDYFDYYFSFPSTVSVENEVIVESDIYVSNNTLQVTSSDVASLQLYNLTGQKVLQLQGVNEVNLNDLPNGIYIVNVILENGKIVSKKVQLK